MKRIRLFAAAALILLCGAGTGFRPQKDTIRVATWNVDSGSADLSDQKEFLSGIDADIIGLQEAEEKTARVNGVSVCDTLAEGLFRYAEFFESFPWMDANGLQKGSYGLGVLSKGVLLQDEVWTLPSDEEQDLEPRILTMNKVSYQGKFLYFYNLHLSYEDDQVRAEQLEAVNEILAENSGVYQIGTGDFNIRDLAELDALEGFQAVNTEEAPLETYHGDDWDSKCLDNILYSGNLELVEAEVCPTDTSDHDLLLAEFRFLKKAE
mgnify:FL=1